MLRGMAVTTEPATATGRSYVEGNLAPVHEELTVTELAVTGELPDFLDGRYLRNGPNPVGDVDPSMHHWFMGAGMVHGVRLRDGRAEWYRNRWVRSRAVAGEFAEPWPAGPVHAGMDMAANTNVIGHAGRTLAIIEAGALPYELTDELATVAPCDFDGTLSGGYAAHPKIDPVSGELHAMTYYWGWGDVVKYVVIGVDGRVRKTVDVQVTGSPMMHDFSLTERHVVMYDLPVTFDLHKLTTDVPRRVQPVARFGVSQIAGRRWLQPVAAALMRVGAMRTRTDTMTMPYSWDPSYPARVGVMSRDGDGSDLRWYDVEPCYVFHPLNAYDDGDRVVLDVVRHPKMFATDHNGPNEGSPHLYRWVVDQSAGKVAESQRDDHAQEFPRVDERVVGRPHRYGYAVGFTIDDGLTMPAAVLKHDLETGTTQARSLGAGTQPSELVFVPSSPDAAEDDGVLVGFVFDPASGRSDLTILDARSLDDVAKVHLPARVPAGFHGNWIPTPPE